MVTSLLGDNMFHDTLRFIEEKAGIGLWELDLQTNAMRWSGGLYNLLGVTPEAVHPSSTTFNQYFHPDDVLGPGKVETVLRTAGVLEREFRIIQPNGRTRRVINRGELRLDRTGRAQRAIGIVIDITRQHEQLAPAVRNIERLTRLVESIPAWTWLANCQGELTELICWCQLTGQSPDQAARLGWTDAVHPSFRSHTQETYLRAISEKRKYVDEYLLRFASGEFRWVRSRATPVFCPNGNLREWIGIIVDIHDDRTWTTKKDCNFGDLTGSQIRAARAIVNWSVRDLAMATMTSPTTIRRLEELNGRVGDNEISAAVVKEALEKAGVEFLFLPSGPPGVRPKSRV